MEDRHASDEAIGKFKSIDDKDHGMHLIRVFPKRSVSVTPIEPAVGPAMVKSLDEDVADAKVNNVLMGHRLKQLTLLGLAEFLCDLFPILQAGLKGKKSLSGGSEPEPLQLRAFDSLDELQATWTQGFQAWKEMLAETKAITSETKAKLLELMALMESQTSATRFVEMRQKVEHFAVDDRNPAAKGLAQKERKLKKSHVCTFCVILCQNAFAYRFALPVLDFGTSHNLQENLEIFSTLAHVWNMATLYKEPRFCYDVLRIEDLFDRWKSGKYTFKSVREQQAPEISKIQTKFTSFKICVLC